MKEGQIGMPRAEERADGMSRRRLLAAIGKAAGGAAMYQAMASLGHAAESGYSGPIKLPGDPKGASILILGAGLAGMVAALELRQHRERNGAEAPIGPRAADLAAAFRNDILGRHALLVLADRDHLGVPADEMTDLALEGLGDHVHAADRLKQARLILIDIAE